MFKINEKRNISVVSIVLQSATTGQQLFNHLQNYKKIFNPANLFDEIQYHRASVIVIALIKSTPVPVKRKGGAREERKTDFDSMGWINHQ